MRPFAPTVAVIVLLTSRLAADEPDRPRRAASGCDLAVSRIELAGPSQVDAWIVNRGAAACGGFTATLSFTRRDGRPSGPEQIRIVRDGLARGEARQVSFRVESGLAVGRSLLVKADSRDVIEEADERNNVADYTVTELATPAPRPTPARTPQPAPEATPRPKREEPARPATPDLRAEGIHFFEKDRKNMVSGVVKNVDRVDYVGRRTARLYRRALLEEGEDEDVLVQSEVIVEIPAGLEWAIQARRPPAVRQAKGYVWSLVVDAGDANPENDSFRKDVKQVKID